jgi:hypothetical protein
MMKKITLLLMSAVFTVSIIFAQVPVFFENFNGATALPAGWATYDETGFTPDPGTGFTTSAWAPRADAVAATSWFTPVGQANSWLVTPLINITNADLNLTWIANSVDGDYLESYEVYVSTTGNTVADFTGAPIYSNPAELATPTTRSVSLAAYNGQGVYIAFRLVSDDKFIFSLDDVTVVAPPQFDLEISGITTNARTFTTNLTQNPLPVRVLDFSKRTSFEASVQVTNTGLSAIDSIILTYFLVDDINTPTVGVIFVDTVLTTVASGATYTHTFEAFGLDTLFPGLLEDQVLDFYVQLDSSANNQFLNNSDFSYSFLIAPTESYSVPFETSFEVAFGNSFNFNHREWGWKYLDNNNDGNTFAPASFSNLQAHDGDWQIIGSVINGNQLSAGANNDFLQSPEFTFETGKTYQASIWARTGFTATGTVTAFLTNSTGSVNLNLGPIALVAADSVYRKFTFTFSPTATAADYMFDFRKTSNGLVMLDFFEVNELLAPTANLTLVNASLTPGGGVEYCDSTITVQYAVTGPPSTLAINWGDGNTTTINDPAASGQSSHSYGTLSTFNITATATNLVGSATSNPVSVQIAASPTYEASFTIVQSGNSITIVDASTPVAGQRCSSTSFTWSFGDGSANVVHAGNAAAPTSYTYSSDGTYTIALIIQTPGAAPSVFQTVVTIVNIKEVNFAQALSIFPNPTSEIVNVAFELSKMQNVELSVVSIDGKTLAVTSLENALNVNTSFNVSDWNNGVYFIRIKTEEGLATQRFVVSKK